MTVRALRRGTMAGRGGPSGTPTTYTIYSTSDGYSGAAPSTATGVGPEPLTNTESLFVGVFTNAYESYLSFDTSVVADTATITAVTLSLYSATDASTIDFTVEARLFDWGATLTGADWLAPADLATKTLMASKSTAGWATGAFNVFTSEAAFASSINKTGATRLVLCSSRYRDGTYTASDGYIGFYASERTGTGEDPKLVIEALV